MSCSDCSVKIADFGLSRVIEADSGGDLHPINSAHLGKNRYSSLRYFVSYYFFSLLSFLYCMTTFFLFQVKMIFEEDFRGWKKVFCNWRFFSLFYMSAQSSFHSWIVFLVSFCSALCCLMLFFTISPWHTLCNLFLSFLCCLVLCHTLLCCFMLSYNVLHYLTLTYTMQSSSVLSMLSCAVSYSFMLFYIVLCCPSLSQLDLLCAMFFCPFYVVLYCHKMPTIIVFLWNLISCGHHI